jgi:hypothetical protein
MNTKLFQQAGRAQDGNGPRKRRRNEADIASPLICKSLKRRGKSDGRWPQLATPPRTSGIGACSGPVPGYWPSLPGVGKEKSKKADVALSAMAAQLLDLDPILTAAVILGGEDD